MHFKAQIKNAADFQYTNQNDKSFIIFPSYAVVKPIAMVVKLVDTFVALRTML